MRRKRVPAKSDTESIYPAQIPSFGQYVGAYIRTALLCRTACFNNSGIADGTAMPVTARVQRCVAVPMPVFELWQRGGGADTVKCQPDIGGRTAQALPKETHVHWAKLDVNELQ